MGKTSDFQAYITEIEELREKYKLGAHQVLLLQIAAAFKIDDTDYNKLKARFCIEDDREEKHS